MVKHQENTDVPYMLKQWTKSILQQYHYRNGHLCTEKVVQAIRHKYHWHRTPTEVVEYIDKCLACKNQEFKVIQNSYADN